VGRENASERGESVHSSQLRIPPLQPASRTETENREKDYGEPPFLMQVLSLTLPLVCLLFCLYFLTQTGEWEVG